MKPHASVEDYLASLTEDRRAEVNALRELVLDAEPELVEIVKWNSPNFTLAGEDRLTINAAGKGPVRLILHLGTQIAEDKAAAPTFAGDPLGLLTWHSNIRASLVLGDRDAALAVVRAWLSSANPASAARAGTSPP